MNRQKQILFALIVILGLALLYAWWMSPAQQVAPPAGDVSGQSGNGAPALSPGSAVDEQRVSLELLASGGKKYRGYKRDIFNYYQPKPKPQPVVKPPPQPVVEPKPVPVVTPQVRQQLARFTFLGFLLKENERTVFLSKRDELFLVKKGDSFGDENRFEVVGVSPEKLTIRQSGAGGLIEIRLVEEEPLIPSFSPGELKSVNLPPPVLEPSDPEPAPPEQPEPPEDQRRRWFREPPAPPASGN